MIIFETDTHLYARVSRSRGHHFHQCRCLFQKIQNTLHLIDIAKFWLCQHICRSTKKQPLCILPTTIKHIIKHLNQLFKMINVTLHFLSDLTIQCRFQLVDRYPCKLAIKHINYFLHFCHRDASRNGYRPILNLSCIGDDNCNRRSII
ncbi:hypothetical protein D1872_267640 [compost metagenome]